jgi:hypothetical protein
VRFFPEEKAEALDSAVGPDRMQPNPSSELPVVGRDLPQKVPNGRRLVKGGDVANYLRRSVRGNIEHDIGRDEPPLTGGRVAACA